MKTNHAQRSGSGCYAKPTPPNCGFFKPVEILDELAARPVWHECFFYEDKGRDISFPRWRVCFYYQSHMALTKFFVSAEEKDAFLSGLQAEVAA